MWYKLTLFLAALAAGPAVAKDLKVAVISDLNGSYGSVEYSSDVVRAVNSLIAMKPDLVISTGDMIAGQRRNPHLSEAEVAAMWTSFHHTVTEPLEAAGIPFLVTPGNHDGSDYVGFEAERRAFDKTWTARKMDLTILDGERFPFRYAAELDGLLLISLDVTTVGPQPSEEMDWLRQILKDESPLHKATIVFSHLPIWPVAQGRETEIIGDKALQDMVRDGGVDIYLSGHHHAYFPGVSEGVLYLFQACLGDGPRKLIGTSTTSEKAITVIEFDRDGTFKDYALTGSDFNARLDLTILPRSIGTGRAQLIREDLWR